MFVLLFYIYFFFLFYVVLRILHTYTTPFGQISVHFSYFILFYFISLEKRSASSIIESTWNSC
jgi:hypothetical protein